ncbi:uncharacterized protein LOC106090969 [Stomoxys calcitrans]|uniref:Uncharacterized protein n=1 Tax=Stomoxys calcitrans TaxID=35570 RepID=A0A1I8P735_STOCA|nr:uncharacterized protein LOC106090969 [Stomoxys calcitrans]
MVNRTLCNVIAYLSAIFSGIAIILFSLLLVTSIALYNTDIEDEDSADTAKTISVVLIVVAVFEILACVGMFISAVLLIIGIKRERVSFIAPWVYIVAISVVLGVIKLAMAANATVQDLVAIVIQIAFWYPIFMLYRELRKAPATVNVNYNACPSNMQNMPPYNAQTQPMYAEKHQSPPYIDQEQPMMYPQKH